MMSQFQTPVLQTPIQDQVRPHFFDCNNEHIQNRHPAFKVPLRYLEVLPEHLFRETYLMTRPTESLDRQYNGEEEDERVYT
jgi:hypothetical protein